MRPRAPLPQKAARMSVRLGMPVGAYLIEALAVAKLARRHWRPDAARGLPGLCELEPDLDPQVAGEITTLVERLTDLQSRHQAAPRREIPDILRRARFLMDQLRAWLRYQFQIRPQHPLRAAWRDLEGQRFPRNDAGSAALPLHGRVHLVDRLVAQGCALPAGLRELLEEARRLVAVLQAAPPPASPGRPASGLVPQRDLLLAQLHRRVLAVRAAVRLVFRDHPDVLALAGSAYRRAQRTRQAARKKQGAGRPSREAPGNPV